MKLFIAQIEQFAWTGIPKGMRYEAGCFEVVDEAVESWVWPFICDEIADLDNLDFIRAAEEQVNSDGFNLVESWFDNSAVFLTRSDAEKWIGKQHSQKLRRVVEIECEGQLADILKRLLP